MGIKGIRLKKGMYKDEVNELIAEWLLLEDDVYMGNNYSHNWKCKCGGIIKNRAWVDIQRRDSIICERCKYYKIEQKYKEEVEKDGGYEYIRSFRKGDRRTNGKTSKSPYIQVKHRYCGRIYEVQTGEFINQGRRCSHCCGSYENSFAYHIEVELGEVLEKYWDFEKNTVNPYHISKNSHQKVWIKCQEKDYHGSYDVSCNNFANNARCGYCHPTGNSPKIHPYDSFGYHHFDKVMSWHPDNKISPFRVSKRNGKKYKFICEKCGNEWETRISEINDGCWCPKCKSSKGEKKIINWLKNKEITHFHDKPYFKDLLSDYGNPLRPDFILPEHKIWIEYDGEFHYRKMYDNDNYEKLKIHDERKNKYAKKHGWNMIRIPYWEFDNIENILNKEITFIN